MTGGEWSAILGGVGAILAAGFGFIKWMQTSRDVIHENRFKTLEGNLERVEELHAEQISNLRKTLEDYAHKNRVLEILVQDQARHIHKLERVMLQQGLQVPEFEPTRITGASV